MAFIDLGKLKFNWQGVWNSGTAYETDDVVFHGNQTWVATADVAVGQAEPQANASWDLMNGGLNFRGVYSGATTHYLHDMVTYGSALYLLNGTDNQTGVDPGSNPGSDNWDILTPAPDANVLLLLVTWCSATKIMALHALSLFLKKVKASTPLKLP